MNKNKKITVSDVLNYVFDGENDFGESDESDNEFDLGNDAANTNIEEVSENEYDSTSDDEPLACIASRPVKNANETPINKNNTTPTTYKWRSKNFEPLDDVTFKEPEMIPTPDVEKTPFQYFELFVSDEILNNTTERTNIYILQSKGAEKKHT